MALRIPALILVLTLLVGVLPATASPNRATSTAAAPRPQQSEPASVPNATPQPISLTRIGRYNPGPYRSGDPRAAEIVAHDPASQRMFVVNSFTSAVDIVNISNPTAPTLHATIAISPTYGAAANSVAVHDGVVAVAVEAAVKTDPGRVVFFNANGVFLNQVTVGALPDMLTFTPNGSRVLTANEGEPNSYNQANSVDPEGSVSIVQMPVGGTSSITTTTTLTVTTVGFSEFNSGGPRNGELSPQVRIFGPNASVAQDLEPEYIAVSPNSSTAYVTLQENNALAIINIANASVTALLPLGFKDHNAPDNGLDPSDSDGGNNIANWPVLGMYQPDGIAAYQSGGQVYLVTANEGDARSYTGFNEEIRVGNAAYVLDTNVFTDAANLKTSAQLGRLTVTNATGNTGPGGSYQGIYAFGARSFSIWNGSTGALVYDSGDDIEERTAAAFPSNFNANNTNDTRDNRSDDKGPEPEAVTIGTIGGRSYAFVGLERIGGIMVYDVTNPNAPTFVQYVAARNFPSTHSTGTADDLGPEGITFVPAHRSPNGRPLLLVANEVSGSVSIYEITAANPDGVGTLTLLHNNDGESALLPQVNSVPRSGQPTVNLNVGGVAAFKTVTEREISDARALGNALVNVYAGDAFLASSALACSLPADATTPVYDAIAQRQMPYTVHILGNHEFDYTPVFLKRFIESFEGSQPFLSANLNFSAQAGYADLLDADGLINQSPENGRVIGRSMVYTDTATNQRFGIVGATTPLLPTISSPDNVTVTPDIPATASAVQQEINRLQSLGVTKIILVSHMQSLNQDRELIQLLNGVDIVVAGGGDDLLTNPAIDNSLELLPGDALPSGSPTYPLTQTDAGNRTVYIVTTAGNYRYVGRLDVQFDASGEVSQVVSERSYPRRVVPTSSAATTLNVADAVAPDAALGSTVITPINDCLNSFATTQVARSEVVLDVSRNAVRSRESNAGNLIADSFLFAYDNYATLNGLPARSASNPVIAIQNGGGIRQTAGNAIPSTAPGTISRRNTLDILPFANFVSVVSEVTPADLKLILERSAASLPGEGGQFLQIAGLRVTYNISNTAQVVTSAGQITTPGSRVIDVVLNDGRILIRNGAVVAGAPNVRIVTNGFTASGGDNYPTLASNPNQVNLRSPAGAISYEQAWLEYLASLPSTTVDGVTLPTILASDQRYQPGGEGRIQLGVTRQIGSTGGSLSDARGVAQVQFTPATFGTTPITATLTPLGGPTPPLPAFSDWLRSFSVSATASSGPLAQATGLYTITISYSDEELAARGINEATLQVRSSTAAQPEWSNPVGYPPCRLEGCSITIDRENNRVTLVIDYFGEFALFGSDAFRILQPVIQR